LRFSSSTVANLAPTVKIERRGRALYAFPEAFSGNFEFFGVDTAQSDRSSAHRSASSSAPHEMLQPQVPQTVGSDVTRRTGAGTFHIGEKVIYPNHGLGIVEKIEEKIILGITCGFFHIRFVRDDKTILVPIANAVDIGIRRAISDEEVERIFTLLSDGRIDNHQNWKGRFKDHSDKMRTGSIYDMADVLKSLVFLSKSKSLSFREKRMLDRAKALIISEVCEVTGESDVDIESRVDRALEQCFIAKARNIARGTATGRVRSPSEEVWRTSNSEEYQPEQRRSKKSAS
jgi:CarD family transcriptional regulator